MAVAEGAAAADVAAADEGGRFTSGRVPDRHAPADFLFFLEIPARPPLVLRQGIVPPLTASARPEVFIFGFRRRPQLAP
jgi:hypothetical protein